MRRIRSLRLAAAVALGVLIAGCSGGDDTPVASSGASSSGAGAGGQPATQSTGTNAFLAQVLAVISTSSETAEPAAIDSAPPSVSETAEPASVS